MPGTGSLSPGSSPASWRTSLIKSVRDLGLEQDERLSTNARGGEIITLSEESFLRDGDRFGVEVLVFRFFSNIFTRFMTPAGKSLLSSPEDA